MSLQTKLSIFGVLVAIAIVGCQSKTTNPNLVTDMNQAVEVLQKIQTLTEPSFEKMRNRVALDESDTKKLEEALPLAKELTAFDPLDIGFMSILGKIQIGLDKDQEGKSTLENALLLSPKAGDDQDPIIRAGIHSDIADIFFKSEKFDLALESTDKATALLPQDPYFLTQKASILIELERYSEAKTACQSALKIDPGHKPAQDLLKLLDMPI